VSLSTFGAPPATGETFFRRRPVPQDAGLAGGPTKSPGPLRAGRGSFLRSQAQLRRLPESISSIWNMLMKSR
jgi:hypothetical protein